MVKIYKIIFLILLAVFTSSSVHAASLSFFSAPGSYSVGESFVVGVYVESVDQPINAASGVISFSPDMLQVVSISKIGSIFSFWAEEPSFLNNLGTINFEGIVPNPGFMGASGKILTITFKIKSAGTTVVNFSSSSVLANDGRGTNILTAVGSGQFTFGAPAPINNKIDTEKPDHFDILEIPRQDKTDPKAKFVFDASDDIGIDYYEIVIDGISVETWKGKKSERYETPPYGPGTHIIIVKAVDKSGNFRSSTTEFVVEGLEIPIFTNYPKTLQSEEILFIEGTSSPYNEVHISFQKRKGDLKNYVVKSDKDGKFSFVSDDGLSDGAYEIWAEARDKRGAKSLLSEKITIVVSKLAIFRIGGIVLSFLSILIPLSALVFLLFGVLLYGWHKLSTLRKNLHKEVREAESVLHKSFNLMREDIKDSIEILEKTNNKRELTKEEDKILKQLKRNLTNAEKFITKEIEDIEKII